jgi:hypothetical protein
MGACHSNHSGRRAISGLLFKYSVGSDGNYSRSYAANDELTVYQVLDDLGSWAASDGRSMGQAQTFGNRPIAPPRSKCIPGQLLHREDEPLGESTSCRRPPLRLNWNIFDIIHELMREVVGLGTIEGPISFTRTSSSASLPFTAKKSARSPASRSNC